MADKFAADYSQLDKLLANHVPNYKSCF